jgi:hypothetical protein
MNPGRPVFTTVLNAFDIPMDPAPAVVHELLERGPRL